MNMGPFRGKDQQVDGSASITAYSWEELAVSDREAFLYAIENLGLRQDDLSHLLTLRDDVAREVMELDSDYRRFFASVVYALEPEVAHRFLVRKQSALRRLGSWLKGYSVHVDNCELVEYHIPLFVLSAPAVDGCRVTFTSEGLTKGEMGWNLILAGSGFTETSVIAVAVSANFGASSGEAKVVFLPVSVQVEQVAILDRNSHVLARGTRAFVAEGPQAPTPGLLLLDAGSEPDPGALVRTFPLAGDTSGEIATYEYSYTQSSPRSLAVSIHALGADVGLKGSQSLQQSLTLRYELRGGYDYHLHNAATEEGLVWTCQGSGSHAQIS